MILSVVLFTLLSIIGGYIGYKTNFPLGVVLGSMLTVGLAKVFGVLVMERTETISFIVQVSLGIVLGLSLIKIKRDVFIKVSKSLIFIIMIVIIFTFVGGLLIHSLTGYDLTLSILSVAPGAVVEVATLAQELNLDSPSVVIIHLLRVLVIMSLFPLFIKWALKIANETGGYND